MRFILRKSQLGLFGGGGGSKKPTRTRRVKPAQTQARSDAQTGLFSQPPPPQQRAVMRQEPKPQGGGARPPGTGWEPIPRGHKGGYRKRKAGGGYDYWYPDGRGVRAAAQAPQQEDRPKPAEPARTISPDAPQESELEREVESRNTQRKVHQDTGTVGGAQKHQRAQKRLDEESLSAMEGFDPLEAEKMATKSKIIGTFNAAEARERGDSAGAILVKKKLWSAIDSKPKDQTPEGRLLYMQELQWFERQMDAMQTVGELQEWLENHQAAARGMQPDSVISVDEYNKKYTEVKPSTYGGETRMIRRTNFAAMREDGLATWSSKTADGQRQLYTEIPMEKSKDLEKKRKALGKRFDAILSRKSSRGGKLPAFWDKGVMQEALEAEKSGDFGETESKPKEKRGPSKAAITRKKLEQIRWEQEYIRVGGSEPPKDLTGQKLKDMFGLREMQWGQTVDDERAETFLEQAATAMMDLADVMGVDSSIINMNGRLALAYGARGKGRAAAHYEHGRVIINITKEKGAGSFAHEWAHFLDNQITGAWVPGRHFHDRSDGGVDVTEEGQGAGSRFQYASHGGDYDDLHPEVRSAVLEVMGAIHGAPFDMERKALAKRRRALRAEHREAYKSGDSAKVREVREKSQQLNKDIGDFNSRFTKAGRPRETPTQFAKDADELGSYWKSPHEMFARAFEAYVQDKLRVAGRRNTFLVMGTSMPMAYPAGEERTRINAAFDKMVVAMRTHKTLEKAMARIEAIWAAAEA